MLLNKLRRRRRRNQRGQSVTEYGSIVAFVAILVAMLFGISSGTLKAAISGAYSALATQLNNLSTGAGNATS